MQKDSLHELPVDIRDIQFGQVHTLPSLKDIPDDFVVEPPFIIKNQKNTDFCTAFASTSALEADTEKVELSPIWQFAQTKKIMGNLGWGASLRDMAKSYTKYGAIKDIYCPYKIWDDRNTIADYRNYDAVLYEKAEAHKQKSYMFISGQYDVFDNIRATMFYQKKSCVTGVKWCSEWTYADGGVVDKVGTPREGHAIRVLGSTIKNNKPHLIVQNSYGQSVGDNGVYYFSRDVINKNFKYGAVTFTDIPAKKAKKIQDTGKKIDEGIWFKLLLALYMFLKKHD